MSFALQPIADATARALLAQLLKRNLLPVATGISEVVAASPLSGNGSVASPVALTGAVPRSLGGTGGTATPASGGVGYGTGTALAYTAAGVEGQVLKSNGASAPTWMTPGKTLVAAPLLIEKGVTDVTPERISDDWVWRLSAGQILTLQMVLAVVGTATSAPRFKLATDLAGEWPAAAGGMRLLEFLNSVTVPAWQHLAVGVLSTSCASSVPTTQTIWSLDAVIVAPDDCQIELQVASSTTGQSVKVLVGSLANYTVEAP